MSIKLLSFLHLGELSKAVRDNNMTFGLYHSFYEWFNPLYLSDKAANYTTQNFVNNKVFPEMLELVVTCISSQIKQEQTNKNYNFNNLLLGLK